jgi:hypothetical protein
LQWLGFGLSVSPEGFDRDQTLGLRSIIPLRTALRCLGQGEKQCFLATHLEYRAFYFRASCTALLRLFESISHDSRTQPFLLLIILDFCRKPAGFEITRPPGSGYLENPLGKDSR